MLLSQPVDKCLSNPFGRQTTVLSFGFGCNGQLGDGLAINSFVPVKVRMPNRCELIGEVSAGKSWSLARCCNGTLYSWGRGLRGQLGQGVPRFSVIPRKVIGLAAFVKVSAGHAHNLSITTSRKLCSEELLQQKAKDNRTNIDFNSMFPLVEANLSQRDSRSAFKVLFICKLKSDLWIIHLHYCYITL